MDAQSLRTRAFIETYKLMRSKKGDYNLGRDFENCQTPDPQPSKLEFDIVMPQAKNTFLTIYDPLESLY
ncbi:MAG: hypothetical protein RH981_02175 [Arenibacter sp.]|jgi:hypothetical protein